MVPLRSWTEKTRSSPPTQGQHHPVTLDARVGVVSLLFVPSVGVCLWLCESVRDVHNSALRPVRIF